MSDNIPIAAVNDFGKGDRQAGGLVCPLTRAVDDKARANFLTKVIAYQLIYFCCRSFQKTIGSRLQLLLRISS